MSAELWDCFADLTRYSVFLAVARTTVNFEFNKVAGKMTRVPLAVYLEDLCLSQHYLTHQEINKLVQSLKVGLFFLMKYMIRSFSGKSHVFVTSCSPSFPFTFFS